MRALVWCGLVLAVACGGSSRDVRPRPTPVARLDALFDDLHRRALFDGGAVLVAVEGRELYARGFGLANVAARAPFTPATPTDLASIAKPITASLVLELVAEGKLALDVPAQRYLPELPYPTITLRHLLAHTSALPVGDYDYFDPFIPKGEPRDTERLLAVLATHRPALLGEPGTAFRYSSFGYDLAALAAARAAGTTFTRLVQTRVFERYRLPSAFARPARLADFAGTRTVGYRRDGARLVLHDVFDLEAFHGGSNLYMSVRDLQRWTSAYLAHAPALALAPAPIGGASSALTLGNWYRGDGAHWYPGHLQGFHSVAFHDPRARATIVYTSNTTLAPWLHHAIVRAIRATLAGANVAPLAPPTLDAGAVLDGTWQLADGERLVIAGGMLHHAGAAYAIVPFGATLHYVPGVDYLLGRAGARLYVSSNVAERWATSSSAASAP